MTSFPANRRKGFGFLTLWFLACILFTSGCLVNESTYELALQEKERCQSSREVCQSQRTAISKRLAKQQTMARRCERKTEKLLEEMANLETERNELLQKTAIITKRLEEQEKQTAHVSNTYKDLLKLLSQEIHDGNIRIDQAETRLKLNLADKVLFPSGSADLTLEGQQVLEKLGLALRDINDRRIIIEGHTDDIPISNPAIKRRYPSNWELSALRATAVVRHLQEKVGLNPKLLCATGYSMYKPVADNSSPNGRQANRRIEIILIPLTPEEMQSLYATPPDSPPESIPQPSPPPNRR